MPEHKTLDLPGEFPAATPQAWREAAEELLKGAPFDKILRTPTPEGVTWEPIYTAADVVGLPQIDSLPGQFPYLRGTRAAGYHAAPWAILQGAQAGDPQAWNADLLDALNRGQNAVLLNFDAAGRAGLDPDEALPEQVGAGGVSIACLADLNTALKDVVTDAIPLRLEAGAAGMLYLPLLMASGKPLSGAAGLDPLGELVTSGTLPLPLADCYDLMAEQVRWSREHAPELRMLCASGIPWHEAGASAVQELAYALATGTAYLRMLQARGVEANAAAASIGFSFALGPVFFTEIAKLRAARMLWANVVQAFGGDAEAQKMRIHVRTSELHATALDPYVNLLRATTQAFSGLAGAADGMSVECFDAARRPATGFSRRLARNIQLMLHEEAHVDHVIDPAGGSYFVEYLTSELAGKAWALLQEMERAGGMAAALESGAPQQAVAAVMAARTKDVARRKDVKIGVNMFANQSEPALPDESTSLYAERAAAMDDLRRDEAVVLRTDDLLASMVQAYRDGATVGQLRSLLWTGDGPTVQALPAVRLSEQWERLRAAVETSGLNCRVFLAGMGPVRQHKARMDWTQGFFEPGGFAVTAQGGFSTSQAAADAASASGAATVVICSSDDTYPELVAPFISALRAARPDVVICLAGYPEAHVEAFRAAGIDEFIHIRAVAWDVLAGLARRLGVQL